MGEKSASYSLDKGLKFRIYKQLQKLNTKEQVIQLMSEKMN
jgi:hypothetical protein